MKDAYKTLVKVWHPDRFPNDEPLRKTAGKNLAQINVAYQYLQANPAPYRTSASQQDWSPSARSEAANYGKSKQENPNSAKGPVADAKARPRTYPNQPSWWVRLLQRVAKYILSDRRWSISPSGARVLGFILTAFLVKGASFFWQSFTEPKGAAQVEALTSTGAEHHAVTTSEVGLTTNGQTSLTQNSAFMFGHKDIFGHKDYSYITRLPTLADRCAAIAKRLASIKSDPRFQALSGDHKRRVLENFYGKYLAPSYVGFAAPVPEREMWVSDALGANIYDGGCTFSP